MRKLLVAGMVGVSATLAGPPTAVHADTQQVDAIVKSIKVGAVVYDKKPACPKVAYTVRHAVDPQVDGRVTVSLELEVRSGPEVVGRMWESSSSESVLSGTWMACPALVPLGPLSVRVVDGAVRGLSADFMTSYRGTVRSSVTGRTRAQQATHFKKLRMVAGRKHTVTARPVYFDARSGRFKKLEARTTVSLLRQKGTTWRTVRTSRVDAKGRVKITVRATKKTSYRLFVAPTRTRAAGYSKILEK